MTMPGGYWVQKWLIADAWEMFWRNFRNLNHGRRHTAESLCADPDWRERDRRERLKLGRCIKYFSVQGILPITLANPNKRGTRKYFLNGDLAAPPTNH